MWEYHTQIANVAKEELTKRPTPTMPQKTHSEQKPAADIPQTAVAQKPQTAGAKLPLSMVDEGIYTKVEVTTTEVILGRVIRIPIASIKDVKLYPMEKGIPAIGGCIKFVTDDNPYLPQRTNLSFDVQGVEHGNSTVFSGMSLCLGNCFWYHGLSNEDCTPLNEEAMTIVRAVEELMAALAAAK